MTATISLGRKRSIKIKDFEPIRRDFLRKFSDVYEFLYNHHDEVAGFAEATEFGDWFIKNHPTFTRNFTDYRGDILTSDREVAAYGFVLMYMVGE